jgi:hypothetical protein
MINQVTIQSQTDKATIKPLVEIAVRNQLKSLRHGIERTKEQLTVYEQRFGLSTTEMERRLKEGSLEETLDTIDWCMELEALRLLEEQYKALNEASID